MGLFGKNSWFRNQFLKVIEWESDNSETIVYKYPLPDKVEIMRNSKLVVREGQRAIFLVDGKLADVFEPGSYDLTELNNIPILTTIMSWKYAFETPYRGDIYFVSTKQFTNNKWGTTNPIMMRDQDFGVIRLRGYGNYTFAVKNDEKILKELFGSMNMYCVDNIKEHFKQVIVSSISDVIAESQISAMDLAQNYIELSNLAQKVINEEFEKLGMELKTFYIENLSLPQEVEKMMDKRTSLGVMNGKLDDLTRLESSQAIRDAANNPGGLAGAGIGLGAGVGLGKMFGDAMNNSQKSQPQTKQQVKIKCTKCGALVNEGVKFCPECGNKMVTERVCPKCGAKLSATAKFCPECGEKIVTQKTCPKCGAKVKANAKFCRECGEKL